jgi:hypothetical protein
MQEEELMKSKERIESLERISEQQETLIIKHLTTIDKLETSYRELETEAKLWRIGTISAGLAAIVFGLILFFQ